MLAPAVVLLIVASLLSSDKAAALLTTAAFIFLAVVAFEAAVSKHSDNDALAGNGESFTERRQTRRLLKLLSFIATSTPTLAGAAEEGDRQTMDDWLELVVQRLERAVSCSAGAMVLREEWVVDDVDLVPYCEVASSAGSPQCVLPSRNRIPINAGIAWDVGQSVGARSIFLAPLSIDDHRFWVCLTLVAHIEDDLLQPITNAMVGPITLMVLAKVRDPGEPRRLSGFEPNDQQPGLPSEPDGS